MSETVVRPARAGDEAAWRALWDGYCEYYRAEVPETVTATTWSRLMADGGHACLVAEREGQVVGFANYLLHPSTWSTSDRCYLEDLFVAPEARGAGAGRALIERLRELTREHGWRQVYWHTERDNRRARALYDSFTQADGFVRYVLGP